MKERKKYMYIRMINQGKKKLFLMLTEITIKRTENVKYAFNKVVPAAALLVMLSLPVFINPGSLDLQICYFKSLTGYSCPTCGLSRSFHAVTQFHFAEAFSFHLMGPLLYLGFLCGFIKFAFESISGDEIKFRLNKGMKRILFSLFAVAWAGFWVVRFISEYNTI